MLFMKFAITSSNLIRIYWVVWKISCLKFMKNRPNDKTTDKQTDWQKKTFKYNDKKIDIWESWLYIRRGLPILLEGRFDIESGGEFYIKYWYNKFNVSETTLNGFDQFIFHYYKNDFLSISLCISVEWFLFKLEIG